MKLSPPRPAAVFPVVTALLLLASAALLAPAGQAQGKKSRSSGAKPARRHVPPKAEIDALVRKTLLDVDKGLETKDFSQLYASLAPTWRRSLPKEALTGIFAQQLDNEQRTDYAATYEPVYDPEPFLDERGVLVAGGHIPSEPQWVLFRLKFYNEGGWKPFGMAVRVQSSMTAPSRLPEKGEKELPPAKAGATPAASPSPSPGASPAPGASPSPAASPAASPSASPSPSAAPSPAASASPSPSPKQP